MLTAGVTDICAGMCMPEEARMQPGAMMVSDLSLGSRMSIVPASDTCEIHNQYIQPNLKQSRLVL